MSEVSVSEALLFLFYTIFHVVIYFLLDWKLDRIERKLGERRTDE